MESRPRPKNAPRILNAPKQTLSDTMSGGAIFFEKRNKFLLAFGVEDVFDGDPVRKRFHMSLDIQTREPIRAYEVVRRIHAGYAEAPATYGSKDIKHDRNRTEYARPAPTEADMGNPMLFGKLDEDFEIRGEEVHVLVGIESVGKTTE